MTVEELLNVIKNKNDNVQFYVDVTFRNYKTKIYIGTYDYNDFPDVVHYGDLVESVEISSGELIVTIVANEMKNMTLTQEYVPGLAE